MNAAISTPLILAACLLVAIGIAHSYLGERYILIRLFRRSNLPRLFGSDLFTKRTLRFAWHLTTVAWWGFAAAVLVVARNPATPGADVLVRVVSLTFLVSAVVSGVGSRGRHLSWVGFLAVAALCWWG